MASPGIGKAIYDKQRKNYARIENGRFLVNSVSGVDAAVIDGIIFYATVFDSVNPANQVTLLLSASVPTFVNLALQSKGGSNDGFDVAINEGATVSANGTQVGLQNRNRLSSNTADFGIFRGPTVTDPGTEIARGFVAAGSRGETGVVALDPNQLYLFIITNNGAGSDDFFFSANIVEQQGGAAVSTFLG